MALILFALWGTLNYNSLFSAFFWYIREKKYTNTRVAESFAPIEEPFLPTKLLKNVNYVAVCIAASVGTMIYFSMNVLWPQQIHALYTTDPVKAGWLAVSFIHSGTVKYRINTDKCLKVHYRICCCPWTNARWSSHETPGSC